MANEQNLVRGDDAHKLTVEEQSKGGIASGIARREKKNLRKCLELLLEKDISMKNGEVISGAEAISAKLFEQALKGNIKAFETVRSTVGQDPVQKIMVSEVEQEVIDEVESMVLGNQHKTQEKAENVQLGGKIAKIDASGNITCTYSTMTKAARENGVSTSELSKAIKGGTELNGFFWKKREKVNEQTGSC